MGTRYASVTICFTICLSRYVVSSVVKSRLTTSQKSSFRLPHTHASISEITPGNKASTSACTCSLHSLHCHTRRRGARSSLLPPSVVPEPANRLPPATGIQKKEGQSFLGWRSPAAAEPHEILLCFLTVTPPHTRSQTSRKPAPRINPCSSTCRTSSQTQSSAKTAVPPGASSSAPASRATTAAGSVRRRTGLTTRRSA